MRQQTSPKRRYYLPKEQDVVPWKTPVRRINVITLLVAAKLATELAAEWRLISVYCIANEIVRTYKNRVKKTQLDAQLLT